MPGQIKHKKLKIAVASSGLGHVARGVEAWAQDLGRGLAERGESVLLFKGGGEADEPYERVIECWQRDAAKTKRLINRLPRRGMWRLGLATGLGIEQWTFTLPLLRYLRRESIDVLHVQEPQAALLVQRARQCGLVSTKVVLAHGTNEPPEYLQKIKYLQHLAPWHMEQARAAGAWRDTWTTLPNFIDTRQYRSGNAQTFRAELGIPTDGVVMLCAAAIKRDHKRVHYLLEEFAQLRTNRPELPVWLIMAGAPSAESDELVKMGRELLGERVRFLVSLPRERMPDLYAAADAFVLCSLREMFGIVLLEALATSLPCIVHRHPVMEWIVGAGGRTIDMAALRGFGRNIGGIFK